MIVLHVCLFVSLCLNLGFVAVPSCSFLQKLKHVLMSMLKIFSQRFAEIGRKLHKLTSQFTVQVGECF